MTGSAEFTPLPRLHLVTNDEVLQTGDFYQKAERLLEAGGDKLALHIRGPGLSGRKLYECAVRCAELSARTGSRLFINDRVDIAIASGADGVHLRRESLPPALVRPLLQPGRTALIGISVHHRAEAEAARSEGADFVFAGTVYGSASHPDRPPAGTAWLSALHALGIPVIGIGGIVPERVGEVRQAGAYGVAAIRAVWHAERPPSVLRDFLSELE